MSSNLKVNNILPSTGTTVAVSGIASVTSSVSIASSCTATTFYGSGANLTSLPAANLTGALPAINGASLTFDYGSSVTAGPIITSSNPAGPKLSINATGTGGKHWMIISNSTSNTDGAGYLQLWNSSDSFSPVTFGAASNITTKFRTGIDITDGDLKVASGHGIDFSATSSNGAGELLDDYEYGSWAPTISAHLGGGSFTYNSTGRYVKVGRLVSLWGYLSWSAKGGSGVVNLNMTGLPFATHNTAANQSAVCIGSRSGWNNLRLIGQMAQSGYINVQYINSSGNSTNVNVNALDNSGSIYYRFQYESAS